MTCKLRWPDSWYDSTDILKCTARGCSQRFHTTYSMGARARHWACPIPANAPDSLETETDHNILLLLNQQTQCPQCNFSIDPTSSSKVGSSKRVDIRHLFEHEQQEHGTDNTTTIDGFVRLVRQRRLQDLNMQAAAEPFVFRRLLQEIQKTQQYALVLEIACILIIPGGDIHRDNVASVLALNRPLGEQQHWAISPEEFLMHLRPDPDNELQVGYNWKQAWDDLRAAYREGRI